MSSTFSLRTASRVFLAGVGGLLASPRAARVVGLGVLVAIAISSVAAHAVPTLVRDGRRWIGISANCGNVPTGWTGRRLFSVSNMPPSLAQYCLYVWSGARKSPASTDIAALFGTRGISDLGQDEPVVYPLNAAARENFSQGLRNALVQQVGGLSILSSTPNSNNVRVVVIDTAPSSPHGAIAMGTNRHGDTLAHLVEDLVCEPLTCTGACTPTQVSSRVCGSQVTTMLALRWTSPTSSSAAGGSLGTLGDLATAISQTIEDWQNWGPQRRVIMNLSVGWEHHDDLATCSTSTTNDRGPERAVKDILQFAAGRGALIFAAAGNDSGGPSPRTGPLCPAAYQAIPKELDPSQPLLVAVSGVDFADHRLETSRPDGIAAFAAPGIGVSWIPGQSVPPQLVGTSVSTAVVSAVAALVWSSKPSFSPQQVLSALHGGGVSVGSADSCPVSFAGCSTRRINTCGALHSAGISATCTPPSGTPTGSPALPGELAQLKAAYPGGTLLSNMIPVDAADIPRFQVASPQVEPTLFPQPISATCPTCVVSNGLTSNTTVIIPALGEGLDNAMLVLVTVDNQSYGQALGNLNANQTYVFEVQSGIIARSAYLTGLHPSGGYSVTEPLFLGE